MKRVTGKEIYEAIKENGWEWAREEYIVPLGQGKFAACAIGQAQLNLDIDIEHTLIQARRNDKWHPFEPYLNRITTFNDEYFYLEDEDGNDYGQWHTPTEITAFAKEVLTPVFDEVFEFNQVFWTAGDNPEFGA